MRVATRGEARGHGGQGRLDGGDVGSLRLGQLSSGRPMADNHTVYAEVAGRALAVGALGTGGSSIVTGEQVSQLRSDMAIGELPTAAGSMHAAPGGSAFAAGKRQALAIAALVTVVLAVIGWAPPDGVPGSGIEETDEVIATRIVHRFDFNEREEGNLEDLPRYWLPFRPPDDFPRFAIGGFDFEVGHAAPPSFHLDSQGRNVAFEYNGPETRVRLNATYRVVGYIRADRLEHGRACLTAQFLDRQHRRMAGTLVRSRFVSGGEDADWVRVVIDLGEAPQGAYSIGLIAWVMQQTTWEVKPRGLRHIPFKDVHGGAWFDDIEIRALPRVELTTTAPGNVLVPGKPQELLVTLADVEGSALTGLLTVRAADGELVTDYPIQPTTEAVAEPQRFPVEGLVPGLYEATLDVKAAGKLVATTRVRFARLSESTGDDLGMARPFGVVIDPALRGDPDTELALLQNLVARSAKLPTWSRETSLRETAGIRRARDRMLQELARDGFVLTGVLVDPPASLLNEPGAAPDSLLELLTEDRTLWQEHLAAVVAPYAGMFRWWQVGADDDPSVAEDRRLPEALEQVRQAMKSFLTSPLLVAPTESQLAPWPEKLPAEQLSVVVGAEVPTEWLAQTIDDYRQQGYQSLGIYLESLPANEFARLPRLGDWAIRILHARHAGRTSSTSRSLGRRGRWGDPSRPNRARSTSSTVPSRRNFRMRRRG
jgi:hypothetical protein